MVIKIFENLFSIEKFRTFKINAAIFEYYYTNQENKEIHAPSRTQIMHQIKQIPNNNNTEFSFEKADRKTLENILKNLENQEKELLKESTQNQWQNLPKHKQISKSLYNFNFQDSNNFIYDNLRYPTNLDTESHWYNDGVGLFQGEIYRNNLEFPTFFHPQTHFPKINQHTMFEMNYYNRSLFDHFPTVNYSAKDFNGLDMNAINSPPIFPYNNQMPLSLQYDKERAYIQKSKSAYLIKPNRENRTVAQTFDLSSNPFINNNFNKTFYSTPKMISKNIKTQAFAKNIQTLNENHFRKTLNNVNSTLGELSKTTLEEKIKNNLNNKTFKKSPNQNKSDELPLQQKISKKNLTHEDSKMVNSYLRSKSLHDNKISSKVVNPLKLTHGLKNTSVRTENNSFKSSIVHETMVPKMINPSNAAFHTTKINLSQTLDVPVPSNLNFKNTAKIVKNFEDSEFSVKAKRSKSFSELKKQITEPVKTNRSNQNSFYKDLKLADLNTFKNTIEYHEDDLNTKNNQNSNQELINNSIKINQASNMPDRGMFDTTSDELEEIFINQNKVKNTMNQQVLAKKMNEYSANLETSKIEIIQKEVKQTQLPVILNKQVNSAFKSTSALSKSKTQNLDVKTLSKPLIEPSFNRNSYPRVENEISKENMLFNSFKTNQLNQNFDNINNYRQKRVKETPIPTIFNKQLNSAFKSTSVLSKSKTDTLDVKRLSKPVIETSFNRNSFIQEENEILKKNRLFDSLKTNPNLNSINKIKPFHNVSNNQNQIFQKGSIQQVFSIPDLNERIDQVKKKTINHENNLISALLSQNINPYETEAEKETRLREICDYLRGELDFKKSEGSLSSGYDSPSSSNSLTRENVFESNKSLKINSKSKISFNEEMPCEEAFGYLIVDLNQFENADDAQSMNSRKLWIKDIPVYIHENSSKSSIQIFS